MQTDSSKNSFFKKLVDKDKEKSTLLYSKGKENLNSQIQQPFIKKNTRIKTQTCISLPTQHQIQSPWLLDCRHLNQSTISSRNTINNWLNIPSGIVQFGKIVQSGHLDKQFTPITSVQQNRQDNRKSIIVQIWIASSSEKHEFMQIFIDYALPLIKIGKGVWSVAAITQNKRYDLLSLDSEGTQLWKGKTPLSKVQLQKQSLMKRVFGYSIEKEKVLGSHQTLAKVQFTNFNSTIYFILRDPRTQLRNNAQLLIQQEIITQNITNIRSLSILRVDQSTFMDDAQLTEVLKKLSFRPKLQEELSKNQRQRFLKAMIEKLQGELVGKQEQLKLYKSQKEEESDVEEDFGIPSQRISMGQDRYLKLKRQIKDNKCNE